MWLKILSLSFTHRHVLQTCMTSICGTKKIIFLKGSYDASFKDHYFVYLCVTRICWHALIFKKHIIFSNTVHYCSSSMPRLSQMRRFLQAPPSSSTVCSDWPQLASALWLAEHHKHGSEMVTSLTIIASAFKINVKTVNNLLSFTISSSPKGEQSHVTDTVMMLVWVCTQAAIKKADSTVMWPCLSLSLLSLSSLSHTHTHTHTSRD